MRGQVVSVLVQIRSKPFTCRPLSCLLFLFCLFFRSMSFMRFHDCCVRAKADRWSTFSGSSKTGYNLTTNTKYNFPIDQLTLYHLYKYHDDNKISPFNPWHQCDKTRFFLFVVGTNVPRALFVPLMLSLRLICQCNLQL